mmetsp:Transcript_31022/g.82451  ORF Transcript_31022/g.82451 Transcript_31022/m.82451 type:complete len:248 (+) Transcript_31022:984-1727(+)
MIFPNRSEDVSCDNLSQAHVGPRHGCDGVVEIPAVAMKHWQRPEIHSMPRKERHNVVHTVEVCSTVVQEDAFGIGSCAARVAQRDRVPLVLWRTPRGVGVAFGKKLLVRHGTDAGTSLTTKRVVHVHHKWALVCWDGAQDLRNILAEFRINDNNLGLGMLQHEPNIPTVEAGVQRVQYGPCHGHSEMGLYVLRSVAENHRNHITPLHSPSLKGRTQLAAAGMDFRPGTPCRPMYHRNSTWKRRRSTR